MYIHGNAEVSTLKANVVSIAQIKYAAIAQLVERRHGKAKVTGSSPVGGSTLS